MMNVVYKYRELYMRGSATLTVFLMIVLLVPLLITYGIYLQQQRKLIIKDINEQEEILELQSISDAVLPDILSQENLADILALYEDYEIRVEDLSSKINPYFVREGLLDLQLFEIETNNEFSASAILSSRNNLQAFNLVSEHIPVVLQTYFTKYSYINANVDSIAMIKEILQQNTVAESTIDTIINTIDTYRNANNYISARQLSIMLQAIPQSLQSLITTRTLLNINTIDLRLLAALISYASFNVVDRDATIEAIKDKRARKLFIDANTIKELIRTDFGSELIFHYLGDTSWFYTISVCNAQLCNNRVLARALDNVEQLKIIREQIIKDEA